MSTTETITWHPLATDGPPDADIAVMMTLEGDNEPTWPMRGDYFDAAFLGQWRP